MKEICFKLQGEAQMKEGLYDEEKQFIMMNRTSQTIDKLNFDIPINGTIYGTLLNYNGAYQQFESKMNESPYKQPPKAPVLYIKPINTHVANGSSIYVPKEVESLKMGATLGIVFEKAATKVTEQSAFDYVFGYVIVNDVQIPHESIYRPAVKEIARDSFCPIGPWIVKKEEIKNPDHLVIRVYVNGELKQVNSTANLVRPISKLIADVTEFMTLNKGDVLLVGIPENAPLAKVDDHVTVEIEGIGKLENVLNCEETLVGEKI
jgi:5-oxopent-3-ene-1,2,5-tricarboxylate decarboxylase / 2-hydroxyhepta-2,4-diene-1,7-dioate isomerase